MGKTSSRCGETLPTTQTVGIKSKITSNSYSDDLSGTRRELLVRMQRHTLPTRILRLVAHQLENGSPALGLLILNEYLPAEDPLRIALRQRWKRDGSADTSANSQAIWEGAVAKELAPNWRAEITPLSFPVRRSITPNKRMKSRSKTRRLPERAVRLRLTSQRQLVRAISQ